MKQIKLAVADGTPLFLNALNVALGIEKQFSIVIMASSGRELMQKMLFKQVDIVLLDTHLSGQNGLECLEEIRDKYSSVKVIMLSNHDEAETIRRSINLGASSYLSKENNAKQIVKAIKSVYTKGNFIDERYVSILAENYSSDDFSKVIYSNSGVFLTPKEIIIIQMICKEMISLDIAICLNHSKRSIETYRNNIIKKIGCRNIAGVVTFAVKNRLIYC